jgi:glycosyltransferase involved in cell wall biosynthesis
LTGAAGRLDLAVLLDAVEENWPSMDLVGEMFVDQCRSTFAARVEVQPMTLSIPRVVRRLPAAASKRLALNADRALARYVAYPLRAVAARRPGRLYHVVDHSYAQLVHALPATRTGVYCHDLDAFRAVLSPEEHPRSRWFRALSSAILAGVRAAAIVFYSTREIGLGLERLARVPRSRLVHAPYGVGREFSADPDPDDGSAEILDVLGGRPFVLHVGSGIPRKRIDVLFEVFAKLRSRRPDLRLVQQGAALSAQQHAHAAALGLGEVLLQPPKLSRRALAGLYRRATVVLVPSEAEGFGFPVIEALACGAVVVASDIPVLREVGSDAVLYAPVGDVNAWTLAVEGVLNRSIAVPTQARRRQRAAVFTWEQHASTILDAYAALGFQGPR